MAAPAGAGARLTGAPAAAPSGEAAAERRAWSSLPSMKSSGAPEVALYVALTMYARPGASGVAPCAARLHEDEGQV